MKKIDSFKVNHLTLEKGLYVSRKDNIKDEMVTTFDIRMTKPNTEPVMDTAAIHSIEHLGATFLRNDLIWQDKVIYFGPMGCRTGFYLLLTGKLKPFDIISLIKAMFTFIVEYKGEIPGSSPRDCGNYLDLNLDMAKYYANAYLGVLKSLKEENTVYSD